MSGRRARLKKEVDVGPVEDAVEDHLAVLRELAAGPGLVGVDFPSPFLVRELGIRRVEAVVHELLRDGLLVRSEVTHPASPDPVVEFTLSAEGRAIAEGVWRISNRGRTVLAQSGG